MDEYILKDADGNLLISITNEAEEQITQNPQFTHCLAVVKLDDDYLLGWNRWRKRWEIFGGCIERGETARDCIVRECCEELGIRDGAFQYLSLMKLLLMPDYFSREERIEYGGLYGITLHNTTLEDVYKQIRDRDEIVHLALYSDVRGKENIAQIDEVLLKYYRNI